METSDTNTITGTVAGEDSLKTFGQKKEAPSISQTAIDSVLVVETSPNFVSFGRDTSQSADLSSCQTSVSIDHVDMAVLENLKLEQSKKKSQRLKRRGCYEDLAMAIGPELAATKVSSREPEPDIINETRQPGYQLDSGVIDVRKCPEFSALKLGPTQEEQPQILGAECTQTLGPSGNTCTTPTQCEIDLAMDVIPPQKVKEAVKESKPKSCYVPFEDDNGPMLAALEVQEKENQDLATSKPSARTEENTSGKQGATRLSTEQNVTTPFTIQQPTALTMKQQPSKLTTEQQVMPERNSFRNIRRIGSRLPSNLGEVSTDELNYLRYKLQNTLRVLERDDTIDVVAENGLSIQNPQGNCFSDEKRIKSDTVEESLTKRRKSKKCKKSKKLGCYSQLALDIGSELANLKVKVQDDENEEVNNDTLLKDKDKSEPFVMVFNEEEKNEELMLSSVDTSQEKNQCDEPPKNHALSSNITGNLHTEPAQVNYVNEQPKISDSVDGKSIKEQLSNEQSVTANVDNNMRSTVVADAFGDVLTTVC